jgi:hypothetical protein
LRISTGQRLRSQVDATELIVVRSMADEVDVRCGGASLIDISEEPAADPELVPVPDAPAPRLGKRYTDPAGALELLITKAGTGVLTAGGHALTVRDARPLPASD